MLWFVCHRVFSSPEGNSSLSVTRPFFLQAKNTSYRGTDVYYIISLSVPDVLFVCCDLLVYVSLILVTARVVRGRFTHPGVYKTWRAWVNVCEMFCMHAGSRFAFGRHAGVVFEVLLCVSNSSGTRVSFTLYDIWLQQTRSSRCRIGEGTASNGNIGGRGFAPAHLHQVYDALWSELRVMA